MGPPGLFRKPIAASGPAQNVATMRSASAEHRQRWP